MNISQRAGDSQAEKRHFSHCQIAFALLSCADRFKFIDLVPFAKDAVPFEMSLLRGCSEWQF